MKNDGAANLEPRRTLMGYPVLPADRSLMFGEHGMLASPRNDSPTLDDYTLIECRALPLKSVQVATKVVVQE